MKIPVTSFIETQLPPSFLLITCGLPATGKSSVAAMIAKARSCQMLRSDLLRQEIFKNEDVFAEEVAANRDKRLQVYQEMFRRAGAILSSGSSVILDATFFTRELRRQAAEIADRHRQNLVIIETVCSQAVAVKRILWRRKDQYESNALTEQAYLSNQKDFEPVNIGELKAGYPGLRIFYATVDTEYEGSEQWYVTARGIA
jgi:predicted kinase